jgi:hypothetical protein
MKVARRLGYAILALLTIVVLSGQGASAQVPSAERHIGRISTANWVTPELTLYMYGVYGIGANGAVFHPPGMPTGINQTVLPYIRVPDGGVHRYRLDCQVDGRGPAGTTTVYQFREGTNSQTSTQPQGAVTVSFQVTVDGGPGWRAWSLTNASDHTWVFYGCDVYELLA